jgi:hypothetical protein
MRARVCDLRYGDLFLLLNREYRVQSIKDGRIYFVPNTLTMTAQQSLGAKSQQLIEITKKYVPVLKPFPKRKSKRNQVAPRIGKIIGSPKIVHRSMDKNG